MSQLIKNNIEQPRLQTTITPVAAPPPTVAKSSAVIVPLPLAPALPRVETPVVQPPVIAYPSALPQFQKLSALPAAPRVQMRQPFVPVSKPYYHLNRNQMFFNMPTLKQRLAPQPVGQPRLL